jgi:hypothetical protein
MFPIVRDRASQQEAEKIHRVLEAMPRRDVDDGAPLSGRRTDGVRLDTLTGRNGWAPDPAGLAGRHDEPMERTNLIVQKIASE